MTAQDPISTFSTVSLQHYFDKSLTPPKWRPWLHNIDDAFEAVPLSAGPVKVGKLKELFRGITSTSRYRFAIWKWLRPHPPCLRTEELDNLQKQAGLEHLDATTFLRGLRDHGKELLREHPMLRLWIETRISLLEYKITPPLLVPDELRRTEVQLRRSLLSVQNILWQSPANASALATELTTVAMQSAAQAAFQILGGNPCRLSANLMVPTTAREQIASTFSPNEYAKANTDKAAGLWEGYGAATKFLVVVAETAKANHLGFWIPIVRGDKGSDLPGAPFAYQRIQGASVFKDDLPPLTGFPTELTARWNAYMLNDFKESLFISLPFRVPTGHLGTEIVAAVLNVNADPQDIGAWRRAYHQEWLSVAANYAAPFIEIAYYAIQVQMAAQRDLAQSHISLDTGHSSWDTLPGVSSPKLLPSPKDGPIPNP